MARKLSKRVGARLFGSRRRFLQRSKTPKGNTLPVDAQLHPPAAYLPMPADVLDPGSVGAAPFRVAGVLRVGGGAQVRDAVVAGVAVYVVDLPRQISVVIKKDQAVEHEPAISVVY
jgi:hypothetical protein